MSSGGEPLHPKRSGKLIRNKQVRLMPMDYSPHRFNNHGMTLAQFCHQCNSSPAVRLRMEISTQSRNLGHLSVSQGG